MIHQEIIESATAGLQSLKISWRRKKFRRTTRVACAIAAVVLFFCSTPLLSGSPIVDVSRIFSRALSQMLDSAGVVHVLNLKEQTIRQSEMTSQVANVMGIGWLVLVSTALLLIWAALARPAKERVAGLCVASVILAVVTNLLVGFLAVSLSAIVGLNFASGIGWLFTLAARTTVMLILVACLIRVVSAAVMIWRFRCSVQNPHLDHGLPQRLERLPHFEASILAGGGTVTLALWMTGMTLTTQTLITDYRDVAERSLRAEDLFTTSLAIERLQQLDASSPAHRFLEARMHEAEGDLDSADEIVRDIVQAGGRRYAPAHQWLSNHIAGRRTHLSGRSADGSQQQVNHLNQTTLLDPDDINAHVALAETYLQRRSPEQAIRELEAIVDARPEYRLTLARLCVVAGQTDSAKLHGELSRQFYEEEVESYPLAVEPRLRLAASLIFLEDFSRATKVLLDGWSRSQEQAYSHGLGTAYLVWHDTRARQGATKDALLSLLEQSLKYDIENAETLTRVAMLATTEGSAGPAIELLARSLKDHPIPAGVHLILGTNAFHQGRLQNALRHLEEAYRLNPHDVETLNNLAYVLSRSENVDLERARSLVDEAVQKRPNDASLRETRGQILVKLGLWSTAIADLENALQVIKNKPQLHESLATAYEQLGDDDIAAEHRRIAEELANRQ